MVNVNCETVNEKVWEFNTPILYSIRRQQYFQASKTKLGKNRTDLKNSDIRMVTKDVNKLITSVSHVYNHDGVCFNR